MNTIPNRNRNNPADRLSHSLLAGLVLVTGLMTGCDNHTARTASATPTVAANHILATIGSTVITREDFQHEVERRGRGPATEMERTEWLAEMVRLETLYANATTDGLDRDPEIQLALKKMVAGKYLENRRNARTSPVAVSDAEVAAQYQARHAEFTLPEKVRFAVIMFKLSAKAVAEKKGEMMARAGLVRTEALASARVHADFGPLAQQYSEDNATRFKGGDAGYVTAFGLAVRWPSNVLHTAFALRQVGEISRVIVASDGLYLLKLIERQPAAIRPLNEVSPMIRQQLTQQRAQQAEENFFAAESTRAGVIIHQPALQTIPLSPTGLALDSRPPAVPRQDF